jgi:putative phosphoesterase
MKKIGIISDTHGTFDKPLQQFLGEVDEIWHAGDIGSPELADRIAAFKPLRAVYGNIDGIEVRQMFGKIALFDCEGVSVAMTHIGGYPGRYDPEALKCIRAHNPKLFIAGHSHILKVINDNDNSLLHLNPGAAGCSGMHLVRTAIRLVIDGDKIKDLEVGEWDRR